MIKHICFRALAVVSFALLAACISAGPEDDAATTSTTAAVDTDCVSDCFERFMACIEATGNPRQCHQARRECLRHCGPSASSADDGETTESTVWVLDDSGSIVTAD